MKLKEMRLSRGLSQSKLASKAGINVRTLQNYEQGFKDFNNSQLKTVVRVADALNCNLQDIIDDQELIDMLNKMNK